MEKTSMDKMTYAANKNNTFEKPIRPKQVQVSAPKMESKSPKQVDLTCLADGYVFETSQDVTGINANEIVVGPTRSGKTVSVVEPKLLHTYNSSVIVSLTKRTLVEKYTPIFQERGYEVWDLNLANPKQSNIAYDPFAFIENEKDITKFAQTVIEGENTAKNSNIDPYWSQSAISAMAAMIGLAKANAESRGKKLCFSDFYDLYSNLKFDTSGNNVSTSLDYLFEAYELRHPGNQPCRLWKTLTINAPRTAYCIFSTMNNAVDKLLTPEVVASTRGKRKVSFADIGTKKVILFVTTSPVNKSLEKLSTMFFADAFKTLFEFAESLPSKELPVKTHLICDDFATGSKIPDFDQYLSVFCAKGISVTLLLQSESQLEGMYGAVPATTIINNCDTYLYLGGMDNMTCRNISKRRNIPIEDVYSMPLEQVMLFRRGAKPVSARRYQTYQDPLYKKISNQTQEFYK